MGFEPAICDFPRSSFNHCTRAPALYGSNVVTTSCALVLQQSRGFAGGPGIQVGKNVSSPHTGGDSLLAGILLDRKVA